jgi:hypothetical protein
VHGLEYDEDPDYNHWQGIFNDLLDPYILTDESFEYASTQDFEDLDDDLVDGPNSASATLYLMTTMMRIVEVITIKLDLCLIKPGLTLQV